MQAVLEWAAPKYNNINKTRLQNRQTQIFSKLNTF